MIKNIRFYYLFLLTLFTKKPKKTFTVTMIVLGLLILLKFILSPGISSAQIIVKDNFGKPTYIEGLVGEVNTLNPIYQETLAEKEINSFLFHGLSKVASDGSIEVDLAESFSRKSATTYEFKLKENIFWQDGLPVIADDVIHTIELTQKPNPSSRLATNFKDVKMIKIDEKTIQFKLKEPFSPFIVNTTVGLIPKHISLEEYRPVGNGEFKVVEISARKVIIESEKIKLIFKLYKTKEEAKLALKLGDIDGLGGLSFLDIEEFKFWPNISIYSSDLTQRQVVLFFNTSNKLLSSKEIRQAFSYAIPKELVTRILPEFSLNISDSSLPLGNWAETKNETLTEYNIAESQKLLKKLGWKKKGDYYTKGEQRLSLNLATSDDPELLEEANLIKDSLKTLGVEVSIQSLPTVELKERVIPERNFETLLIIQELGIDPDQYSLWHSSQKNNANISSLSSDKIDKVLEDGRREFDRGKRKSFYKTFNRILIDETPAVFLYYPKYFWLVNSRVENIQLDNLISTSDRFNSLDLWRLKSKSILNIIP